MIWDPERSGAARQAADAPDVRGRHVDARLSRPVTAMLPLRLTRQPGGRCPCSPIGAHPDDIEIGAGGLLLGAGRAQPGLRAPLRGADRHRGAAARGPGRGRAPSCPARTSPSSLHDLPEGRLPAVWAQVKEILSRRWRGRARPTSSSRRRRTTRTRTTGPSARSCRPCSATSSTSPTRSRNGTATSAVRRCTSRCPTDIAQRKVELLHKCFPSQRHRDWWDDEVFLGLARLRGMECRARVRRGVPLRQDRDLACCRSLAVKAGTPLPDAVRPGAYRGGPGVLPEACLVPCAGWSSRGCTRVTSSPG